MSDAERLAAIRTRAENATPGPWEDGDVWVFTLPVYDDDNRLSDVLGMKFADDERAEVERERGLTNAEFIANAREDIPWLLDRLEVLTATTPAGDETPYLSKALQDLSRRRDAARSVPRIEEITNSIRTVARVQADAVAARNRAAQSTPAPALDRDTLAKAMFIASYRQFSIPNDPLSAVEWWEAKPHERGYWFEKADAILAALTKGADE